MEPRYQPLQMTNRCVQGREPGRRVCILFANAVNDEEDCNNGVGW
jgi:hypothetical protein